MSTAEVQELKKLVEAQSHRIGVLEDIAAIRHLQHAYGYYIDKCHYNEVVELFEEDGTVIFHGGIFRNKAGVKRLYIERFQKRFTAGRNGPVKGFLLDHPQLQDIITVSPDRLSAKFRGRSMMQAGRHKDFPLDTNNPPKDPRQWFEGGVYENVFGRKSVDEPWKIRLLNYHPMWHGDFDKGWARAEANYVPHLSVCYPDDPAGPDEIQSDEEKFLWPDCHTMPFHYPHPVTNEQRPSAADMRAPTIQEIAGNVIVKNGI